MDAPRSRRWQSVPVRLDQALVEAGLARSRTLATRLVREGRVTVNRVVVTKPAMKVSTADVLVADEEVWVSRGAHKLLGALDILGVQVPSRVLDAGASTGGFTQVVLSRGAKLVHCMPSMLVMTRCLRCCGMIPVSLFMKA